MNIRRIILYVVIVALALVLVNAWLKDYPPQQPKTRQRRRLWVSTPQQKVARRLNWPRQRIIRKQHQQKIEKQTQLKLAPLKRRAGV